MKAYKAFNKDLTCRGFQYEIGKTYEMNEEPIICEQGFHACTNFDDVFHYYGQGKQTRICEVELLGDVDNDSQKDSKVSTNKIRIVRELTKKDLLKLGTDDAIVHSVLSGRRGISKEVIKNLSLDSRYTIAMFGSNHYRDMLVDDPHGDVRCAVADNGTNKHRDILLTDKDAKVRYKVALNGNTRHRNILINDPDPEVRGAVACTGNHRHHDILINDSDSYVRQMVAIYGNDNHRDIPSDDEDVWVSGTASRLKKIPSWLLYV